MRLGIAFVPTLPPERLRDVATTVEAAGLDELWVWEDCFKESAIGPAAAALAFTKEMRVGIGLLPVPLRNVALCAMELATLERMFPRRLIAGVGHGVQSWMAQAGANVSSPLTLLEEYTSTLRKLLAGERVSVEGRYVRLDDVALEWPPTTAPPLMLGGAGPKSLALAGRLGDGTLLGTALTGDEIAEACRQSLSACVGLRHPVVATLIAAAGAGAQRRVDNEVARWRKPSDQNVGVAGDASTIAGSIRRLADLGVTSVAIHATQDEPDLPGFVRFLGQEVRPLCG